MLNIVILCVCVCVCVCVCMCVCVCVCVCVCCVQDPKEKGWSEIPGSLTPLLMFTPAAEYTSTQSEGSARNLAG